MVNTKNVYKPLGAHKWFVIRLKAKINTQKKPIMSSDCACALLFFVPIIFLLYSLCVFVSQIWLEKRSFYFWPFFICCTFHNGTQLLFLCVCVQIYIHLHLNRRNGKIIAAGMWHMLHWIRTRIKHTHTNTDKEVQDGGIELGYIWIAY